MAASATNGQPQTGTSQTENQPVLYLSTLLKRGTVDARGQVIGRLVDVIVRLRGADYPQVTGLVAALGRRRVFIPSAAVRSWHSDRIQLASAQVDLRAFERRSGEVLLRADVLGHRLLDVAHARLVRAQDIELAASPDGWVLAGVDVHRVHWLNWLHMPAHHDYQDWKQFEALIGHQASASVRSPLARLRRLKPAQLADLLEDASPTEQHEILTHVHTDPELEADVFEELDDDHQTRLFATLTDAQVADVIAHMRTDDAADAIMELSQERRRPVLDLLPTAEHTKIITLLGYHTAIAGGLMGMDYLALPADTTVADALTAVGQATTVQPEALTNIYSLDPGGRLAGVASLVHLLQTDPTATLGTAADPDPVRVHPDADLIEVTTVMADYNLFALPVVDDHHQIIGLITVDDILEAAIPRDWRRREPAPLHDHTDHPPTEA
jgi:CBS domain-containing protein